MSRRNKNQTSEYQIPMEPPVRMVRHFYCTVDGGIQPCAPASYIVQMPAVVAPIAMVPYSTDNRSLWQDGTEYY